MNPSRMNSTGPPFPLGRITIAGFIWTGLSHPHCPIHPTLNINYIAAQSAQVT